MKSGPEIVKAGLRSFFEGASEDIEKMVENLRLGKVTQSRTQVKGVAQNLSYTTVALLPVLTSLFQHLAQHRFGDDVILDDVQVSCYRILSSIYSLGTTRNPYVERQRPALGECLARLAAAFPVAFLEPQLNEFNPCSVYSTKSPRERAILGLPPRVQDMCPDVPDLARLMRDIGGLAESGARYTEMPHVIEVTLPMLCNYLPRWWERGPDTVPRGPWATGVTGHHLNALLGNILRILVNNLGIDEASWMKRLAVFAQPIVSRARPELLRSHFIPTLEKLKKRAGKVVAEEEQLRMEAKAEGEEAELLIRDEFAVLCRDLYALYPLLIRYVDNSRAKWLTEPNEDAEELFRMVGEVFIYWSKSHGGGSEQERTKKKRRGDRYSVQTSLIVATLKKMLPVGLNMCSPSDQELISLAKGRYALTEHPYKSKKAVWHKLLSKQRRRAVVACFRMTPLYNLPRHRACNMFLEGYKLSWLLPEEHPFEDRMIDDLSKPGAEEEEEEEEQDKKPDPLHQLILHFSRTALTEKSKLEKDHLYMAYAGIMAKSCHIEEGEEEEEKKEDEKEEEEAEGSFEEKEMEKQKLLYQQSRLHTRGAAEMVLQMISACKGERGEMVSSTLKLGISILNGGNAEVQQESISDFYWYYSGKDVIDEQGKRNFSKAMAVAKQVFNSLTEYIQDSSQIELLKELLDLQKDMVVMLLSLLEGNVVNGTIARQMVDMLVESSSNVTMILKFFDMFLKLRDIVSSDAFRDYVSDPRGLISKKDFQKAMDSQKQFEPAEIQFLLSCSEADENEMIDVEAFAGRFQEPARDIGFNVAVLLTNLAEHVPHDQRLRTFLEQAESILEYFRPFLGRIEIMGAARRIERLYFEISAANKAQNFYNLRFLALFLAFAINFILLFYRIPLVIFKREKELARSLEFSGLYITEQPPDDDVKGQWDRLVLNAQSFPSNYWDKFVKRKVLEKYGDIYGRERIAELLGMELASLEIGAQGERKPPPDSSLLTWITSIDIRYQIWKFGVIFTDNSFLYLTWYMAMSLLGHYNNFFFASHLLDIAMG
ncbi:hypothetical protein Q9966_016762 [Columba livia]|nr:hypothetical protein Q9966_016762 [Columba livia]